MRSPVRIYAPGVSEQRTVEIGQRFVELLDALAEADGRPAGQWRCAGATVICDACDTSRPFDADAAGWVSTADGHDYCPGCVTQRPTAHDDPGASGSSASAPAGERVRAPGPLADPAVLAEVERLVEERMLAHREPDGAYACDTHVMVGYVADALERAARPVPDHDDRAATSDPQDVTGESAAAVPDRAVRGWLAREQTAHFYEHGRSACGLFVATTLDGPSEAGPRCDRCLEVVQDGR